MLERVVKRRVVLDHVAGLEPVADGDGVVLLAGRPLGQRNLAQDVAEREGHARGVRAGPDGGVPDVRRSDLAAVGLDPTDLPLAARAEFPRHASSVDYRVSQAL